MFYSFSYTVTANDIVSAKYRLEMPLAAGVIHQVDVLFRKDAAHAINVQIFQASHPLWPTNDGASLRADATVISFRDYYELHGAVNDLYALLWTTDTGILYETIINIGILPKRVIQPLSFEELLSAAAGLE
ncbi:hypothetical protein LCGC14_0867550 [marine sediment metagenome]|uniref:Uncharacterized protein n=1 Tax=marine sediment metagenome TaxID=412755 RepID=A0A0F9PR87_9ZZZZ|nr:hypothetical protein [Desulfobacterales bacterium]